MEANNDMKCVESISAASEYITKYVSKDEPRDEILIELHNKLKNIEE
jgi:hypothetical protein